MFSLATGSMGFLVLCFPCELAATSCIGDVGACIDDAPEKDIAFFQGHASMKASKQQQGPYNPDTVQAAWDNHFTAFGGKHVAQIMMDYTDASVLESYEQASGVLTTATGLVEIQAFFVGLFAMLTDMSTVRAPVVEVTDDPIRQVFLVWRCLGSGVQSATDTFLLDSSNKIVRQNIHWTEGTSPAMYEAITENAVAPAQSNLLVAAVDYNQISVRRAWTHYDHAFGSKNLTMIMQDYSEDSVLKAFDHSSGILRTAVGRSQIQTYFTDLFQTLSVLSDLIAPVMHPTEHERQIFLVWACPSQGIISATDTLMFNHDGKISRQNVVFTTSSR